MSRYKIGDLVRFCVDDAKDELGLSPSYADYGMIIGKKTVLDTKGFSGSQSYLIVMWSDGSLGHVRDDDFTVLELLNLADSE